MNNFDVLGLFPTPVYLTVCDFDISKSLEVFENCELETVAEKWQKEYGLRSEDTYILDNENCTDLRTWILENVKKFANHVLNLEVEEFAITQSWVSVKTQGQKHTAHRHPNSIISGVFYWQDENVDPIIFHKPEVPGIYSSLKMKTNPGQNNFPYAWDSYSIKPRKNTLVLFPSHLKHSVEELQIETVRKCLAFNSMPKKIIGNKGGLDELDFSRLI